MLHIEPTSAGGLIDAALHLWPLLASAGGTLGTLLLVALGAERR